MRTLLLILLALLPVGCIAQTTGQTTWPKKTSTGFSYEHFTLANSSFPWRDGTGALADLTVSEMQSLLGAGGAISTPLVYYVQTNGDNGTGERGNPSKPYATAQAAYNAAATYSAANSNPPILIQFGVGSHTGITLTDTAWLANIRLGGVPGATLAGITMAASAAPENDIGNPSGWLDLTSDGILAITTISSTGTAGNGHVLGNGRNGGSAGEIRLTNVRVGTVNQTSGSGSNSDGVDGGGGNAGDLNYIVLIDCRGPITVNRTVGTPGTGSGGGGSGNVGNELALWALRVEFNDVNQSSSADAASSFFFCSAQTSDSFDAALVTEYNTVLATPP